MVYEPHSLLHRTNAISLSFPYKRLKMMPKLYYIDSKYSTYPKSKLFFLWHFCRIFIKKECLQHYDAKYVKTNLSLHIKIIFFFLFCTIETWKSHSIWSFQLSIIFLSFFCSIKAFFFVTKSKKVQFRNRLNPYDYYRIKDYKQLPKNCLN